MTVTRFRRVEDMPETWLEPGSEALARAIEGVWDFGHRTLSPRFPPGVHRHRTFEALQALEEEWDARNFEAFHARRRAAGKPPRRS